MTGAVDERNSTEGRDGKGRFCSGNPGRKLGSKNRFRTAETLEALSELRPAAVAVVKEQLAQQNPKIAMWLLDRFLPESRALELPSDPAGIAEMMTQGELSTSEALRLSTIANSLASASEVRELMARLDEIEHRFLGSAGG